MKTTQHDREALRDMLVLLAALPMVAPVPPIAVGWAILALVLFLLLSKER